MFIKYFIILIFVPEKYVDPPTQMYNYTEHFHKCTDNFDLNIINVLDFKKSRIDINTGYCLAFLVKPIISCSV